MSGHDRAAEDDEHFPAAVVDATSITFQARLLDPHLICKLCGG